MRPTRIGLGGSVLVAAVWLPAALEAQATNISLAGTWRFALESRQALGTNEIFLPGTTDLAGYGTRTKGPEPGWLSRPYSYQGKAFYERDITVPEAWRGEPVTLFLERAHWQTEVWVDDKFIGTQNSLSTPHIYDLGRLLPGRHRLTICVDNSLIVDVGVRASSVTDYTQTNWNGIIGRIEIVRGPWPGPHPPPPHSAWLRTRGTQFVVGDTPILLRGTLECANFPLTGHPPMDYESWWRMFKIASDYGLNHIRFHSWCPPEAAFEAADMARFYVQVELPVWSHRVGKDPELNEFMRAEGLRILKTYRNHPSFAMLSLGNELNGDFGWMDQLIAEFKRVNPNILYTFTDDIARRAPGPASDYYVANATEAGRLRIWGSRFAKESSGTDVDFSSSVAAVPVPLIAHELGQWAVYPSYEEIGSYTGVLKPRNLEAFRDQLAARGMLDQAKTFEQASGRFAWTLYREDIETALRTPGFGGFQLLQLQDFSGQGEALVGMLDAFWNSKRIVSATEFRNAINPDELVRFPKRVWTSDETFAAKVISVEGREPRWSTPLGSGTGDIRLPLGSIKRATRVPITAGRNYWNIWVYPKQLDLPKASDVLVTSAFDDAARARLAEGGKVVLLWPPDKPNGHMQPMSFLPVFWSLSWFPKQPGTMGILCDPKHPALAEFPTEGHSDFQWFELTEGARAFVLDDLAPGFRPIVQVIDDFHRNHKLGAVFEARVGPGKLLVSSLDLDTRLGERVVARQLRYSLLSYAGDERFNPRDELGVAQLTALLKVEPAPSTEFQGSQHKEAAPWPTKR